MVIWLCDELPFGSVIRNEVTVPVEIGNDCFSKSLMIYKENTKEINVK